MSGNEQSLENSAESVTTEVSYLDQAIGATKHTSADETTKLMTVLTQEAMSGVVTWDSNLSETIKKAIAAIDDTMSQQLAAIMHDPKFQKLEGSWRGMHHLVHNSETGADLKIRMLNISKKELTRDLERAVEFDQSQLFKKVYESEFGIAGGEPYAALIGDFEFTSHPNDISLLSKVSNVAAAGFCPFISSASANMFGLDDFTQLTKPRDLEKVFDSAEYIPWRSFRESEDSRFVTLTLPRTLARVPYGENSNPIDEFKFEESRLNAEGEHIENDHDEYCWMNAAYSMGTTLTQAFSEFGWCTSIRGAEGGGKVTGLPNHTFLSDDGDKDQKCPTEVGITDRREAELSKLGFLPLCHYKNTDYAVFFGGQTCKKPEKSSNPDDTANSEISARLPYIMATSRIAHFLKVMARDKIGSFLEANEAEEWLNKWISDYVNASPSASAEMKARYPLAGAQVRVQEVPGQPGSYHAVAHLRPWLQMEELTASLRLVATIPTPGG